MPPPSASTFRPQPRVRGRHGPQRRACARTSAPAARRTSCPREMYEMRRMPARARPEGMSGMRRQAPGRRSGPPCPGQEERPALCRPRPGAVPARGPRREQAAAEGAARRRALHVVRLPPARRGPLGLRAVPERAARIRPPALRCPQGRRPLRALRPADVRRLVPLWPLLGAGTGAHVARAAQCLRQEALRQAQGATGMRGLLGSHRRRGALSELRPALQRART